MSQAARCPHCRTVFKVQSQQLEASGGWARCGRCGEVFNALQALVAAPAAGGAAAQAAPAAPLAPPPPAGGDNTRLPPVSALYRRAAPAVPAAARPAAPPQAGVAQPADLGPLRSLDLAAAPAARPAPGAAAAAAPVPAAPLASAAPAAAPPAPAPAPPAIPRPHAAQPTFLQPAAAGAAPPGRRPWTIAAGALALMLALQGLTLAHEGLLTRWPRSVLLLRPLCAVAGCTAEVASRRLSSLVLDSSALSRLAGDARRYRLSVVLSNRDRRPLQWPAIDLRLTDAQGVLLARKVLTAPDFIGADAPHLAAGREQPLQAVLDLGELPVAGYSVELFYP